MREWCERDDDAERSDVEEYETQTDAPGCDVSTMTQDASAMMLKRRCKITCWSELVLKKTLLA